MAKVNDNKIRGIRASIPSNVVIGRVDKGTGKAQLLDAMALRRLLGPGFIKALVPPSTLTVQDEGTPQSTTVNTLNFVGAGVTASGAGATETITVPGYTDEQAQDAVGTILLDSSTINFTYNDATPSITADVIGSGTSADYATEVLADTPTAYWKCNEASGSILDYGGGGFNLTTVTNVTYNHSPLLAGESTRYLRFTNTNSGAKLTSGLGLSYPLTDLTVECIVMAGSGGSQTWFGIDGGAGETEALNSQVELRINGAAPNAPGTFWENGAGSDNTNSSPTGQLMRVQSVYHVAAVRDATAKTWTYYVNGRLQDAGVTYTNNPTGGTGTMITYIGATGVGTTNNGCVIGHVAIYNGQKLSAARIFAHALAAGLTGSS